MTEMPILDRKCKIVLQSLLDDTESIETILDNHPLFLELNNGKLITTEEVEAALITLVSANLVETTKWDSKIERFVVTEIAFTREHWFRLTSQGRIEAQASFKRE
jgi:hypothetical protein